MIWTSKGQRIVKPCAAECAALGLGLGLGFGGGAAFTPLSPSAPLGLRAWYRADLGVTIATGVSAWADQSGVGSGKTAVQATGSRQPTFVASDAAFNNQPLLSFASASSQGLATGAWSAALSQPSTFFMVGSAASAAVRSTWIDGIGTPNRNVMSQKWVTAGFETYAGAFADGAVAATASPVIFCATFNAASSKIRISRATPTTVNAGTAGIDGITIGGAYDFVSTLNGKIAEVIVYAGALSNADVATINAYLGSRYGIAIGA